MNVERDDPEVCDLADEYTMLEELGRGGNAIVYKAVERVLSREVAIKVVRPRFVDVADDAIERLAREARTVARLQHSNIVTVYAVKRLRDGGLALVMQLVPGRTLKQTILDDGPLVPARAERVLREIAEALAFAHAKGVVHRDVKPENVFLDAVSGRAMLSDFGIAHSADFDSRLTMTGVAIGTPAYMAPEQIDGAAANARSDLYSLGLLTWEMLTGERPWEGETLYSVIAKQKQEDLPAIDALRPGVVPPRLQYITERMLQKKPAARWAGAQSVVDALSAWVEPSDWRQWEESHRRRREVEKTLTRTREFTPHPGAYATVRFARPAGGLSAQSTARIGHADNARGQPALPEAKEDDDAPSWAAIPVSPKRSRLWLAAALLAVAAVGSYGMHSRRSAEAARGVAASAEVADAESVALPNVVRDSLSGTLAQSIVAESGADSVIATPVAAPAVDLRVDDPRVMRVPAPSVPSAPALPVPSVRATDDPGVIAAGGRHSCVLRKGTVYCWGANDFGQLGDGTDEARVTPAPVTGERLFSQVTTGLAHSCGVARGGDAYCWGAGDGGQLGDATTASRSAPVRVVGNQPYQTVRAGLSHTCGLTTGGEVWCWGANANGQLGDGTTTTRSSPVLARSESRFIALTVGWHHSCAINGEGVAFCWGANANGQLGLGTRADARVPSRTQSTFVATSFSAGSHHTCAIASTGEAYCWGRNAFGQLGNGTTVDHAIPMVVSGSTRFASVTSGGVHSCARTYSGQAWCWGRNSYGQLGDGSTTVQSVPTRVIGSVSFAALNATGAHTCGTATSGDIWCWGFNVDGQLGDGSRDHLARPTRVAIPEL